jgi:hypothetical protein
VNIALWIAAVLVALVALAAGLMKLARGKEALLRDPRMGWAVDFSPGAIKFIGLVEVLAAVGLVAPGLTRIAPVLVGWAAIGLAVVMAGAIAVHVRRSEGAATVVPIVILALSAFVAWGRFGAYPL